MSYDNTNKGAIWKNDQKENDKHPDFKGSLNVEGCEYWVSAWKRDPGEQNQKSPALKFSVKRKDEQAQAPAPAPQRQAPADNFADEDLPF